MGCEDLMEELRELSGRVSELEKKVSELENNQPEVISSEAIHSIFKNKKD